MEDSAAMAVIRHEAKRDLSAWMAACMAGTFNVSNISSLAPTQSIGNALTNPFEHSRDTKNTALALHEDDLFFLRLSLGLC